MTIDWGQMVSQEARDAKARATRQHAAEAEAERRVLAIASVHRQLRMHGRALGQGNGQAQQHLRDWLDWVDATTRNGR